MAKIIFVTGGAQSGKARWAVNYLASLDNVIYLCIYDHLKSSIADRIRFQNEKNGIDWDIRTSARNLHEMVRGQKFAILDSLGEYTNYIIRENCDDLTKTTGVERMEMEKKVADDITELIWEVKETDGTLLVLSTEMGLGPVEKGSEAEMFRKMLGNINQRVANQASEVFLLVSGIPMKLK